MEDWQTLRAAADYGDDYGVEAVRRYHVINLRSLVHSLVK